MSQFSISGRVFWLWSAGGRPTPPLYLCWSADGLARVQYNAMRLPPIHADQLLQIHVSLVNIQVASSFAKSVARSADLSACRLLKRSVGLSVGLLIYLSVVLSVVCCSFDLLLLSRAREALAIGEAYFNRCCGDRSLSAQQLGRWIPPEIKLNNAAKTSSCIDGDRCSVGRSAAKAAPANTAPPADCQAPDQNQSI